jgi:hypothetical protein
MQTILWPSPLFLFLQAVPNISIYCIKRLKVSSFGHTIGINANFYMFLWNYFHTWNLKSFLGCLCLEFGGLMMNKIFSYKRKMYAVFVDGIEGRRKKKASEPNYCPDKKRS